MKSKLLLLFVFILIPFLSIGQWELVQAAYSKEATKYDISFSTPLKGMAISINSNQTKGFIVRSYDGGENWDTCYTAINPLSLTILNNGENVYFALLNNFKLLRTTNFGQNWDTIPLATLAYLFDFPSPSVGYYFSNAGIYRSLDSGKTWSITNQYSIFNAWDMEFANDSMGLINTPDTLYRTIDSGQTWTPVFQVAFPLPPIYNLEFPSPAAAYLLLYDLMSVDSIRVMKSTDQGASWQLISRTPIMVDEVFMEFPTDSVGYICGSYYIIKTNNGGVTWVQQQSTSGNILTEWTYDLDILNDTVGFISSYDGELNRTTRGGELIDTLTMVKVIETITESCLFGGIRLWLPKPRLDTVIFHIERLGGTATYLIDFNSIPDSVMILPGDSTITIPISTIPDTLTEGIEDFTLVIPNSLQDTFTFNILDPNFVKAQITASSTISCNGSTIELTVSTSYPTYPLNYSWSPFFKLSYNNAVNAAIAYPDTSEWYKVSVGNFYNCLNITDSIFITHQDASIEMIIDSICHGDSIWFANQYIKSPGNYIDSLVSIHGCDSIINLNLVLSTKPPINIFPFSTDTVCSNLLHISLPIASPPGGSYSGKGVNGPNFNPIIAGPGMHWVYYSYKNTQGCTNVDSISIVVLDCTSIDEIEGSFEVNLYPNPASQAVNVRCNSNCKIHILNLLGNEMLIEEINAYHWKHIDLSNYSKGVYFIEFRSLQNTVTKQFIIQ